jgi:hypothetical protein
MLLNHPAATDSATELCPELPFVCYVTYSNFGSASDPNLRSQPDFGWLFSVPVKAFSVSYSDQILGAAIFDLSGLPKDYYISLETADISWVQTIFQALGLQALLHSTFKISGFRHAVIHGTYFYALIIQKPSCYVALLIQQNEVVISEQLIAWATDFDPASLAQDPRFTST